MNKEKKQAEYYEKTNFSKLMKSKKGRHVIPFVKRITINISERIYQEANELDTYMSMGYQNILKTAMTLGLHELYNQVHFHKLPSHKEKLKKAA
jgi:hypothetical protein